MTGPSSVQPRSRCSFAGTSGGSPSGDTTRGRIIVVQVHVAAELADRLEVRGPSGVAIGPVALRLHGDGDDRSYPDCAFTALPNPREFRNRGGVVNARH